jgi:hypothetical protein
MIKPYAAVCWPRHRRCARFKRHALSITQTSQRTNSSTTHCPQPPYCGVHHSTTVSTDLTARVDGSFCCTKTRRCALSSPRALRLGTNMRPHLDQLRSLEHAVSQDSSTVLQLALTVSCNVLSKENAQHQELSSAAVQDKLSVRGNCG